MNLADALKVDPALVPDKLWDESKQACIRALTLPIYAERLNALRAEVAAAVPDAEAKLVALQEEYKRAEAAETEASRLAKQTEAVYSVARAQGDSQEISTTMAAHQQARIDLSSAMGRASTARFRAQDAERNLVQLRRLQTMLPGEQGPELAELTAIGKVLLSHGR